MNLWHQLTRRFCALFRKARLDAEMEEEMRGHIELRTQANIEAGMNPEEARFAALRQFGASDVIKEDCRDQRGMRWLENFVQDIRYGARQLRKHPGFTLVAVLTLALGIGATTAITSVLRTAVFDPIPLAGADRFLTLKAKHKQNGWTAPGLNPVAAREVQAATNLFRRVALWEMDALTLEGADYPHHLEGLRVTSDFFTMFSVAPQSGRLPVLEEGSAGAAPVIVLSHTTWQRHFGSDTSLIGRSVRFKEDMVTVIGVMPPHFAFPRGHYNYWKIWPGPASKAGDALQSGRTETLANTGVIAELQPDTTIAQARAMLELIRQRQAGEDPLQDGFVLLAENLSESFSKPELRRTLWALTAAITLVLLIAAANLANLQLTQTEMRQQELAIRSALGAGQARVFRQLLSESLLLAVLGGIAGLIVTFSGLELLTKLLPGELPRLKAIELDGSVLALASIVTLITGVLFGVAPAWRGRMANAGNVLKLSGLTSTAGPHRGWFTRSLIIGQIALVLVLLTGAGLMVRSVNKLLAVDVGFDARRVVKLYPPIDFNEVNKFLGSADGMAKADAYHTAIYNDLQQRLSALPGVQAVGIMQQGQGVLQVATVSGGAIIELGEYLVGLETADPLQAIRARLKQGSWLERNDTADGRKRVLLNESAARRLGLGEDAAGKKLWLKLNDREETVEVAGVISDLRENAYNEEPAPTLFRNAPMSLFGPSRALVMRTAVHYSTLRKAIERELKLAGAGYEQPSLHFMEEQLYSATAGHRTFMRYLLFFASTGLLLAAIGLYGVMAFSVSRRTREIGIRVAVGAQNLDIIRLIVRQGISLVLLGTVIGLIVALVSLRAMNLFLFGIPAHDPVTLLGVIILTTAVALFACWLPARRATRVDPMVALRTE